MPQDPAAPSPSSSSAGAFAYQTRLLESSSLSRTSSLSRSSSQSRGLLAPNAARRWTPSHKPAASVDSLRGNRARTDAVQDLESSIPRHQIDASSSNISRPTSAGASSSETRFSPSAPPVAPNPNPTNDVLGRTSSISSRRNTYTSPLKASDSSEGNHRFSSSTAESPVDLGQSSASLRRTFPTPTSQARVFAAPDLPASLTAGSPTATSLRRHTSSASVESVRGRWEERVREAEAVISPQNTGPQRKRYTSNVASTSQPRFASPQRAPLVPLKNETNPYVEASMPTPTQLKRRTMPNLTSLSSVRNQWEDRSRVGSESGDADELGRPPPRSNTGGSDHHLAEALELSHLDRSTSTSKRSSTVIAISPLSSHQPDLNFSPFSSTYSSAPQHVHLSSTESLHSSSVSAVKDLGEFAVSVPSPTREDSFFKPHRSRDRRSNSTDSLPLSISASSQASPNSPSFQDAKDTTSFRSSFMRKRDTYGHLGSRKLGQHLPRIASGDGNDDWEDPHSPPDGAMKRDTPKSIRIARDHPSPFSTPQQSPIRTELVIPAVANASPVQGKPDRIRLSRQELPPSTPSPLPSARLTRGLWADTQRHLLIAYEYLCHIGEAQQWIEGCLDEELGFGVVEMEEGLRNGVVLARLARIWEGEAVIRRIFEHPKLQYRHSDNINHFLTFVRGVGLPEGFIFELTDLYEKKNIPKVIYCIHALSHLLSRRGMAQRIGNLLGQLQFSDDQLQLTQKGLKDAGVAMPNFGSVGRELAKEINEEPEEEVETDDERRDRLLLENEDSIILAQSFARGFLARKTVATHRGKIQLAQRSITKLQARSRGYIVRQRLAETRAGQIDLTPWIVALQSHARGLLLRMTWTAYVQRVRFLTKAIVKVQAQGRGALERRRFLKLKSALRSSKFSVVKLQAIARAKISRHTHTEAVKVMHQPIVSEAMLALQAQTRGVLVRRRVDMLLHSLSTVEPQVVDLQSHARAALVRRRIRNQLAKLDDAEDTVVQIQASCRSLLARRQLLRLVRALRQSVPSVVGFQAMARAAIRRREHVTINKALAEARVITSVGGLQTLARAALARTRRREQSKQLDFAMPDVVGLQAACRGALARDDYYAWRDHLRNSHPEAIYLQALLRGSLERRRFKAKLEYFQSNLDKVVKIQSLFRAKEQREQYRQLTMGTNVNVGTIKNFVHLLDDSEADFEEEIAVERLRKRVVEHIRENQALETEVNELDVKIALVVQNAKNFEELIKARRHGHDTSMHSSRASVLAQYGDPFSGSSSLDHATKRRLELYQQLFYLVQTKSEYFARLFFHLTRIEVPESTKRMAERVALTIFGYGQDQREDYLLLQLFKLSIEEEIISAPSIQYVTESHPMYITVAVHYVRPRQVAYVRDSLQAVIREVIEQEDLDLETDPVAIYRARINEEEMRTGRPSSKSKEVDFQEAVADLDTRPHFIRHLQKLQVLTNVFVQAITTSTRKMPYGMRSIVRETLNALKERFPNQSPEVYASVIGRLIYYRYLNPAIVSPETFDMFSSALGPVPKKNLGEISKMLTQIASGQLFGDENPCLQPLNSYVGEAIIVFTNWFLEVADIPDADTHFHAHEFLDVTVQPKPIYISPNEVYAMHSLLAQHIDVLAPQRDDPLRLILSELDGVPNLGSEELKEARDRAITLSLTNRFANVRDPNANEKALWVQAKRGVLAVLRVQPASDLVQSLVEPVTEEHEYLWEEIVENELVHDNMQQEHQKRMPSTGVAESAYRLEDIRSLPYAKVKEHALFYLLELEKQGKITRADGYQGVLNAIAGDLRSKHRKRIQRKHEREAMNDALKHLKERKMSYEEQIRSYHSYIDSAMNTMQKGKGRKRFVMPFTKQFFHMRELQRTGKTPQFGSYIYRAQDLYDKGILLSIDQFSPRQFDRINIVLQSNEVGVFGIKVTNTLNGETSEVASQELRMEDLLQANFEGQVSLALFEGKAKVNLNLLLFQINKKFYV